MMSESEESKHRHDVTAWAGQKIAERRNGTISTTK